MRVPPFPVIEPSAKVTRLNVWLFEPRASVPPWTVRFPVATRRSEEARESVPPRMSVAPV